MKDIIIGALLVTTGILAYAYYDVTTKQSVEIAELTSNRTTDLERLNYGDSCLNWFVESTKKSNETEPKLILGRSWKKHGQLVFEVFSDFDQEQEKRLDALCTYDIQSGMMFRYEGASRDFWMFY